MSDIFREVDEQYRQEQLLRVLHAHAPRIIAGLVVAIALAGGIAWWRNNQRAQAEAQTFALTRALEDAHESEAHHISPKDSRDIMVRAGETLTGGRKVAAQLAAARYAADAGDTPGALSIYDAIMAEHGTTEPDRRLAQLAALDLRIDSADPAQLTPQLEELAKPGSPWRFQARELQGLLAMRQGNFVKSKDIFTALSQDSASPPGLRQRAASLATVTSVPSDAAAALPAGKAP